MIGALSDADGLNGIRVRDRRFLDDDGSDLCLPINAHTGLKILEVLINVAPTADQNDQHQELHILDLIDHSVVARADAMQTGPPGNVLTAWWSGITDERVDAVANLRLSGPGKFLELPGRLRG